MNRIGRRAVVCVLLIAAFVMSTREAFVADLIRQASVIDGNTLEIHGTRIRLWSIDAPESTQLCRGDDSLQYRCDAKAANDLDAFIVRRPTRCVPVSPDQYGRTVARWAIAAPSPSRSRDRIRFTAS